MYQAFYHLTRPPFELSPDPYFLYPTARHNEALAALYYGVERRKGFVVLTGEVGTGKTLLLRCLFDLLDRQQIAFASLFHPRLTVGDFFQHLLADLGVSAAGGGKASALRALNQFLLERHRRQISTVLVVDEAQQLSAELLEEIRLLTNLETASEKLLQIILAGQPELDALLDSPGLRQLKQRVALRCRLEPLTAEETAGYVRRRLERAAAGPGEDLFPPAALAAIHARARGIPRLINTLCDQALIAAFARQAAAVTVEMVAEAAADFRLDRAPPSAAPAARGERQLVRDLLLRVAEALAVGDEAGAETPAWQRGRV